ncbi:hypothetical protein M768_09890 [Cellulosimicrobium cellulans F16]|uniref:Uncharacterized protein n=1 Tax=Cellulosimicrobium cellulans F16 TaxID=1350482 RepID=A0A0M0F6N6_CELCE|nr:hypothetical protein M768_09890 [Cellulosimicrobium cellulans F16]
MAARSVVTVGVVVLRGIETGLLCVHGRESGPGPRTTDP